MKSLPLQMLSQFVMIIHFPTALITLVMALDLRYLVPR